MTTKICEVCKVGEFKYKCPQCLLKYCSVKCYKSHKEICQKPDSNINDKETTSLAIAEKTEGLNDILRLGEEETADRVPLEKLQMLENSSNMKVILENPHLRAMMENLCNSEHAEQEMAKAMMEPIFTEFADECLKIVENDT
ncbi:hypothetical protein LOTGIDRAFT_226635 [Lottia gigantea]|uniref:Zinc finger HIT domain-containing protein 3 n=1 Tax=Lottia gigantea TaxID=225164 RepID=V4ATD3_LOTGI|nr:hypothetical protein LOTGIDRAFT_226635 [Lottia gigantea]ESO98155.1 hypothetical protein LOTGIDRAFT_226635 [Lottia gigantea]